MKYLPALLLLLWGLMPAPPVSATTGPGLGQAQVIGHGCTTAYFIDDDCDGCGPGVKSPAQQQNLGNGVVPYPVSVTWQGTATWTSGSTTVTINSTTLGYLQTWPAMKFAGTGWGTTAATASYPVSFGTYGVQAPYGAGSGTGTITVNLAPTQSGSGSLQTVISFGIAPYWTMGDTPDADDTDPTVCTAADWMTKYGWTDPPTSGTDSANNAAMVSFLNSRKHFANTSRIFYVSQAGSSTGNCAAAGTATPNAPSQACQTFAPVLRALSVTSTTFTGNIACTLGSTTITVAASGLTGALTPGTKLTGGCLPAADYVVRQLSGTAGAVGVAGTYQMSIAATSSSASVSATGINYTGGVVVIRGGSNTPTTLYFSGGAGNGSNPSFQVSGSQGYPVLMMNFPGERVLDGTADAGGNIITATGSNNPGRYTCCVIWDGISFQAATYGTTDGIHGAFVTDYEFRNCEMAGMDDGVLFADKHVNVRVDNCVFHDIDHHATYDSWGGSQSNSTGTLVNGSNVLTLVSGAGNAITPMLGSTVCLVASCTGISYPPGGNGGATSGASVYTWITAQLSGATNSTGTYQMNNAASATVSTPQSMIINVGADFEAQTGLFNFNQDDKAYYAVAPGSVNTTTTGASYNWQVYNNVAYNDGNGNYEPFHVNDVISGCEVYGNISSYTGGPAMALQTGDYNCNVSGNLFFFYGSDCINIYLDRSIVPMNEAYNAFVNNVCMSGATTEQVRGESPGDGSVYQNPTQNGVGYFVKYTLVQGNTIVGQWTGAGSTAALDFESYSYPESFIIKNNNIWNAYTGNSGAYSFQVGVSASPTAVVGNYTVAQLNTCSNWSANCVAGNYAGNTFSNPNFPNCPESALYTPGQCNFGIYNLK